MISIDVMTVADIPAALHVWDGQPGITLREADTPEMLTKYLVRNPGCSFVVRDGAKVIGALHVGDRSKVGANAVVVKDVPADVTVVGVPARIVRRNGLRVDEPL